MKSKRHFLRLPLIGSLLAHGLLLLVLFWGWLSGGTAPSAKLKTSKLKGPIQVGIRSKDKGTLVKSTPGAADPTSNIRTPKSQSEKPVYKFGLTPSHPSQPVGAGLNAGGGGSNGRGGEDGYEVANGMGIEEETRLYPFFSALWKKIDAAAGYPDDFVRQRMTGYVTAQLVVDHRGVFTGRIAKVSSDQPMLETYALAVLFHALSAPLPEKLWSSRERVTLVSQFSFHTFTYGQIPPQRTQKELKNILEFERYGYTDPKLKQNLERWMTRYMPPIIPIPGGIMIDFIRAYQLLSNLGNHKMDEDELRLERIDLKREQWQSVLRRSGTTTRE